MGSSCGNWLAEHKKDKWKLIATLMVMAFIFIQSAFPADLSSAESDPLADFVSTLLKLDIDMATFLIRKAGHFSEYAILGIFLMLTLRQWHPVKWRERFLKKPFCGVCAWGIGTLYAVSDEIHQLFVPGRSCEFRDICIDAAGVFFGVLLAAVFTRKAVSAADVQK